jgi:FAD/FMN-containing dehydrogenase/NAD-dependent dihydropyrimidine dehydrogenase PreA subunit
MNISEIKKALDGIKVLDTPAEREMYSHDIGDIPPVMTKALFKVMPDIVVQPQSIVEISRVIQLANKEKIPVVTRGAASWGFGGVIPAKAGIVIDLSPFRKIIEINLAQKTATVEAGARWSDIDIKARQDGLCIMTYPSSKFSTVGGWLATGGYAINSFKYGHLSQQIVSIKAVTGTGEIKKLTPTDPEFKYYVSTEGQIGIIAELTFKLRPVPQGSYPTLIYFPNDKEAFEFILRFVKSALPGQPNTIRFMDENHMMDINELTHTTIFEKKSGVLFEFGDAAENETFQKFLQQSPGLQIAPAYAANYLWNERLFGMKSKRLGPTILASEVIIPTKAAASFIKKSKRLSGYFSVEVCIDSYVIGPDKTLVMATFLCDSRKKKYYVNVPLVAVLTKAAIRLGAEPYGVGLWNAGYVNKRYNRKELKATKEYKAKTDPNNVLNTGKTLSRGEKGLSGILFNPAVFGVLIELLTWTAPLVGGLATLLFGKNKKLEGLDYELSTHACAKCGNCIAVCPAYLVTHNETSTAKGKIAIAKKMINGQPVTKEEAQAAFMCMKCRACEEICQTNLELMTLWDTLEKKLEERYGRPEALITDFITKVDKSDEYWTMVEQKR